MVFKLLFSIRERLSDDGCVARAPPGPSTAVIAPALDHLSLCTNDLLPTVPQNPWDSACNILEGLDQHN